MQPSIEIIPSHKIDNSKWDACIQKSDNSFIYATSVYLNFMSDNWHGIVVSDYECVMPIPWRKKFGIRYCYDVPFIQQLGWFQQEEAIISAQIFQQLSGFIKYGDYAFNFANGKIANGFSCNNYVLDLSPNYNAIERNYNTDLINNLKKAYKQELIYTNGEHRAVIDLYKNLYQSRMPHVSTNDFENFKGLCEHLGERGNVIVRNVLNAKNDLLATV